MNEQNQSLNQVSISKFVKKILIYYERKRFKPDLIRAVSIGLMGSIEHINLFENLTFYYYPNVIECINLKS